MSDKIVLKEADVSHRLVAPLRTITQLAQLEHNWDGYGSAPIQHEAVTTAIEILKATDVISPPSPHIGPVTGGGLQLEWSAYGRELEVEILPDGSLEWVKTDEDGIMDEGELPRFRTDLARQLIGWLMNRSTSPDRNDPRIPDDPSHALICPTPTGSAAKSLSRNAQWVREPAL